MFQSSDPASIVMNENRVGASTCDNDHPVWRLTVQERTEAERMTSDEMITGWSLIQMFGQQAGVDDMSVAALPKRTLPERLATLLIDLSLISDEEGVIRDVSFQSMATAIGTHRETVASILRAFRRQGLIEVGRKQIQVLDAELLSEIGEPSYV